MTIPELIAQTNNQVVLLNNLVRSHVEDIKNIGDQISPADNSVVCLQHVYNSLAGLNQTIVAADPSKRIS